MRIHCFATGSHKGNCYALIDDDDRVLLLDAGVPIDWIKRGLDFDIKRIVGVLVTHIHLDHSLSREKLQNMGIPVYAPYDKCEATPMPKFPGRIQAFPLVGSDKHWCHTSCYGDETPIYGFAITHPHLDGALLYITDCTYVKWKFKDISTVVIAINYADELVSEDSNGMKMHHVYTGHMELRTAIEFLKVTKDNPASTVPLKNVVIVHTSEENGDGKYFASEVRKALGKGVKVTAIQKYKEVELL